jgi:LmbE family N-acetylglucosaminyl deacetylase
MAIVLPRTALSPAVLPVGGGAVVFGAVVVLLPAGEVGEPGEVGEAGEVGEVVIAGAVVEAGTVPRGTVVAVVMVLLARAGCAAGRPLPAQAGMTQRTATTAAADNERRGVRSTVGVRGRAVVACGGADSSAVSAFVFFHAHPDDEAIFTGGTIARLSDDGHRVVVVVATGGELGLPSATEQPGVGPGSLGALRQRETARSASLLGAARVQFLGYRDSGMAGDVANHDDGSFCAARPAAAGHRLAQILVEEQADALVVYDAFGIYGHPDHIQVHAVGLLAAAEAGTKTVYEVTVDREYLHFVETHLVEEAILAGDLGLARSHIGVPTVMVTTTVSVAGVLDRKRAAMAAHASQILEGNSALQLGMVQFAAVYGWEWFIRHGPAGPLDAL